MAISPRIQYIESMSTQKGIRTNKAYSCAICRSPHRKELEKLWKDRNNVRTHIWRKYGPTLPITNNYQAFHQVMRRHHIEKHAEQNEVVITLQRDAGILQPGVTIESFAQKLLEMGNIKVNNMTPDELNIKDVLNAQKLLIDKQKIKLSEDAMTMKMAELFGGVMLKGEETVTDAEILGYTELPKGEDNGNT